MGMCLRPKQCAPTAAYLEKTAQIYIHIKDGAERPSDKLGRPIVAMVQTAQAIMGKDATRGYAASSAPRVPFPVQDACGLRDGRRRTRKAAASGAAR